MVVQGNRSWLVLGSAWLATAAIGCTEGDDPKLGADARVARDAAPSSDANEEEEPLDASSQIEPDSGARDAAREASPTANCGTPPKVCTAHSIPSVGDLAAGCARNFQDAEVCGISSQHVLMGEEPKFLEKNAKGVPSASCAAFYDMLEPRSDAGVVRDGGIGFGNGRIDKNVTVALNGVSTTLRIAYTGCCTELGFCSADGNQGTSDYGPSSSGFGCMESSSFFRYLPALGPAGSPGAGHALRAIPCDRDSGTIQLPDLDAAAGDAEAGASDAGVTDTSVEDATMDADNG